MQVAVEGDPLLLNRYDVILLNANVHPRAKQAPAHQSADWLAYADRKRHASYMIAGQRLFHPESSKPP